MYDFYFAFQANSKLALHSTRKAFLRKDEESITTVNTILNKLKYNHISDSARAESAYIAAKVGNLASCMKLLVYKNQEDLSESYISAVSSATAAFGWNAIGKDVTSMVQKCSWICLSSAAALACQLLFDFSEANSAKEVGQIVLNRLIVGVLYVLG